MILLLALALTWQTELKEKIATAPPPWMLEQIRSDLASSDLSPEKLTQTMAKDSSGSLLLARYQIKDNQLTATMHPSVAKHPRDNYLQKSLKELLATTPLPDIDFIIALGDAIDNANLPAPVYAFAKDTSLTQKVLLIPDFEALQRSEKALNSVAKGIAKYPWHKKKNLAYWRGSATGGTFNLDTFLSYPRTKLVAASLASPNLIDARLARKLVQSDEPQKVLNTFAKFFGKSAKIPAHFKYKYQVLVDGNTCAYSGAYWRFFSNCAVIKHDSPHIQWYYRALLPNIHYIPCKADFSDLPDKILWAKAHDAEVKAISENAQRFANQNLRKADVYHYLYLALTEYAKVQKKEKIEERTQP